MNWHYTWFLDWTGYKKPMLEIEIKRLFDNAWCTIGALSMPGFLCSTIELPKTVNIDGKVRIPSGRYAIRLYNSPRWGKDVPLLLGVTGRSLIEIHPSNYAIRPSDGKCLLEGCIALGTNPSSVSVDDSTKTWDEFMARTEGYFVEGEVWLTIKD